MDLSGFELYLMREERSVNTISCYMRDVKVFIGWYDRELSSITEFDLIAYKKYLIAKEKTIVTANRKLSGVNAFCKYLYDARTLPEAYAAKLVKNRDKPEYHGVPEDDLHRLREYILQKGNPLHICIIELLLGTGMRVSELTGLTLNDINLTQHNGSIRVIGKGLVNRTLPLNGAARQALEQYLAVRDESGTQRLLLGQRGAIGRGAVEIILGKYGDELGIKVTPHMLRHSLAYKLIRTQIPMTTIQQILGHESILTTNLYCQTREQDKADALESLVW